MSELEDLLRQPSHPNVTRKAPKGWEPGVDWDGTRGTIVTQPLDGEPDEAVWRELVADWGLDPERLEIVPGSLQFRGWDSNVGGGEIRRLRYYRATIVTRSDSVDRADVDALLALASKRGPAKPAAKKKGTVGPPLVVSVNDWQIGKGEGGGTTATVERLTVAFVALRCRLRDLDRLGRRPSRVVLANTGDLTERVAGHYPSQPFTVDLNEREQCRVARRLLFRLVDDLVSDGYPVTVTAVPCNHGENRNGSGKAQTTADDNLSLTIVEGIEEACATNPDRYGDVDFAYAQDLDMTIDIGGVNVGLTHGHQIRGSGRAGGSSARGAGAVEKWWEGQIMGSRPVASADMLLTAHRHHLQVSEETGRTVIVAPALDGGSYWFTSATGRSSPPGMLTLTIGEDHARGWGDLEIL